MSDRYGTASAPGTWADAICDRLREALLDLVPGLADYAAPARFDDDEDASGPSFRVEAESFDPILMEDGTPIGGEMAVRVTLVAPQGTDAALYVREARAGVEAALSSPAAMRGALSPLLPAFVWQFGGEQPAEADGGDFVSSLTGTLTLGAPPVMEE